MTEKQSDRFLNSKRGWITILLLLSCTISAFLLWKSGPVVSQRLQHSEQLDSLIVHTMNLHGIQANQIREREITIDSTFTRKIYSVGVPSEFSKTSFHYDLHSKLLPYSANTIGKVQFPERNVSIQVLYNKNVLRTVTLQTDPLLNISP